MIVNKKIETKTQTNGGSRALPWSPDTDQYIVVSYSGDDDIDFSDSDTWA